MDPHTEEVFQKGLLLPEGLGDTWGFVKEDGGLSEHFACVLYVSDSIGSLYSLPIGIKTLSSSQFNPYFNYLILYSILGYFSLIFGKSRLLCGKSRLLLRPWRTCMPVSSAIGLTLLMRDTRLCSLLAL